MWTVVWFIAATLVSCSTSPRYSSVDFEVVPTTPSYIQLFERFAGVDSPAVLMAGRSDEGTVLDLLYQQGAYCNRFDGPISVEVSYRKDEQRIRLEFPQPPKDGLRCDDRTGGQLRITLPMPASNPVFDVTETVSTGGSGPTAAR